MVFENFLKSATVAFALSATPMTANAQSVVLDQQKRIIGLSYSYAVTLADDPIFNAAVEETILNPAYQRNEGFVGMRNALKELMKYPKDYDIGTEALIAYCVNYEATKFIREQINGLSGISRTYMSIVMDRTSKYSRDLNHRIYDNRANPENCHNVFLSMRR